MSKSVNVRLPHRELAKLGVNSLMSEHAVDLYVFVVLDRFALNHVFIDNAFVAIAKPGRPRGLEFATLRQA